MGLEVSITGDNGVASASKREVDVHRFNVAAGGHNALVTLTHPLLELEPNTEFSLFRYSRNHL